jgi:hypothetical protein
VSVVQLVRFLVVEPAHRDLNPRFNMHGYPHLQLIILSMVGDVPVDSETPVVTSSISRHAGLILNMMLE